MLTYLCRMSVRSAMKAAAAASRSSLPSRRMSPVSKSGMSTPRFLEVGDRAFRTPQVDLLRRSGRNPGLTICNEIGPCLLTATRPVS